MSVEELFEAWDALKTNTRIIVAGWLDEGAPADYPRLFNQISMTESSAKWRAAVLAAQPGERRTLMARIRQALHAEGIKDLHKPLQVPDTHWNRKLKGARPITWLPKGVDKDGNPAVG